MTVDEKLNILADAAKYDVACTSSGVNRKGQEGMLGNARACGICHSFAADGRCISLLKILMTNHCIYDCAYCINRKSNDVKRATFTPDEICTLTIEFYKRNYIEGLFLSSGVIQSPDYTMERICETLSLLRNKYKFNGYIHVKTIPGCHRELIARAGYLADRMSVNMELPTEEGLAALAPNKSFKTILNPMAEITNTLVDNRLALGKNARMERSRGNEMLSGSIFNSAYQNRLEQKAPMYIGDKKKLERNDSSLVVDNNTSLTEYRKAGDRAFAPAGQSTQMIIGATGESDYTLIQTTQKLYETYDLKRVFYSAYIPINEDERLPGLDAKPPLLREHRLYQADWLLRYYGFTADELLSEKNPNFNPLVDPKCDWAIKHLEIFPIEVQSASYEMILKVPGIGPKSAMRIVKARRYGSLNFDILKKMGVVLKRAHYFITCGGKMMFKIPISEQYITRELADHNRKENWQVSHRNGYRQLSLFEDFGVG